MKPKISRKAEVTSDIQSIGTAYYPDHWPESEWQRDLRQIRNFNVGLVRFGEFSWSWFQPEEKTWNWGPYDRFVDLAERVGITLMLCTPTATLPPWFLEKYPSSRMIDSNDHPSHSHRHHWCWNDRKSRPAIEAMLHELSGRYGSRNIVWGWQLDNEPNYAESSLIYDFHPDTLKDFQTWLRAKYNDSLDELNATWFTNFWSQRFNRWEQIGVTHKLYNNNPNGWLDYLRFREKNLGDMLEWQYKIVKSHAPSHQVGCNIPDVGINASINIGIDPFSQSRCLDWVGTDLYYASGNRQRDSEVRSVAVDLMRAAAGGKPYLMTESQGGPHFRTWRSGFAAEAFAGDYITQNVLDYSMRGCEKVMWFLWRMTPAGHEIGMNGVVDCDGKSTPTTQAVIESAANFARGKAERIKWLKRPLALMHYSRDTYRMMQSWRNTNQEIEESVHGWHALLEALGFRIEFSPDQVFSPEAKLCLLPHSHILTAEQLKSMAEAKQRRVNFWLGLNTGLLDERGHISRMEHRALREDITGIQWGYLHDVGEGIQLAGKFKKLGTVKAWRQLRPIKAKICGKFSGRLHPAVLRCQSVTTFAFDPGRIYFHASKQERKLVLAFINNLM